MASVSTPSANEPAKDLILAPSRAKTNNKNYNLKKNVSGGTSDVANTSVHSEKRSG